MTDDLKQVSDMLAYCMSKLETKRNKWLADVYGPGYGPRPIETRVAKEAILKLQGIYEVQRAEQVEPYLDREVFQKAMARIAKVRCIAGARLDGYLPAQNAFLELKVSKIDREIGTRGGKAVYHIGQWASDLLTLSILKSYFPHTRQFYSIILIAAEPVEDASVAAWCKRFGEYLRVHLDRERARPTNHFAERGERGQLELDSLIKLSQCEANDLVICPDKRWAIVSFDISWLGGVAQQSS